MNETHINFLDYGFCDLYSFWTSLDIQSFVLILTAFFIIVEISQLTLTNYTNTHTHTHNYTIVNVCMSLCVYVVGLSGCVSVCVCRISIYEICNIFMHLTVSPEPTQVKILSGAPFQGRLRPYFQTLDCPTMEHLKGLTHK